jgi:hypothetical protein
MRVAGLLVSPRNLLVCCCLGGTGGGCLAFRDCSGFDDWLCDAVVLACGPLCGTEQRSACSAVPVKTCFLHNCDQLRRVVGCACYEK